MPDPEVEYDTTDAILRTSGRASSFFDSGFVGKLEQTLGPVRITHFSISLEYKSPEGKEREELVTIGHRNKEEYDGKVLRISAVRPATFKGLMKVLSAYLGGGSTP